MGNGYVFNTCLCNFQRPIGKMLTINKHYDKGRSLTTHHFTDEPNKLVETMELLDVLKSDYLEFRRKEQEKKVKNSGKS